MGQLVACVCVCVPLSKKVGMEPYGGGHATADALQRQCTMTATSTQGCTPASVLARGSLRFTAGWSGSLRRAWILPVAVLLLDLVALVTVGASGDVGQLAATSSTTRWRAAGPEDKLSPAFMEWRALWQKLPANPHAPRTPPADINRGVGRHAQATNGSLPVPVASPRALQLDAVNVSPTGEDGSSCGSAGSPCATISFAINNVANAVQPAHAMVTIVVAAGQYNASSCGAISLRPVTVSGTPLWFDVS